MGYRGRLIFPFLADIRQLDTLATSLTDPDGPATSGFNDLFREPSLDETTQEPVRKEKPTLSLFCQVETEAGSDEALAMKASGKDPNTLTRLVFHFRELEKKGLVDADGYASLRVGDRLVKIRTRKGNDVQTYRIPLYATQVQMRSLGLSGHQRNLLLITFEERERSIGGV